MVHRIKKIEPSNNLIIRVVFFDGEIKQYDVKQLFETYPQFKELESNKELFRKVVVDAGGYGISWNDELDIDAETIWENGILIETEQTPDLNHLLAYHLIMARKQANMTQRDLADKTGIYQADISKIERGIGNPSLETLKRLAEGLNMQLRIELI